MAAVAAVIVIATLVVMTTGRVPAVLALACALVIAGLLGIATPSELFAGLSNGGVITIAAMLVIAKGVMSTGVITRVTYRLLAGVTSARQALRRLIPPVGIVSALINTTPIVAMLIPAANELEQQSGVPARGVLLPVAHATTLAGSATLIGTSSNLIIAGLANPHGVKMSMFSFVPIAVPVALAGWLVLYVTAPLVLRGQPDTDEREMSWCAEIPVASRANAIGRTAAQLGVRAASDFELVDIQRWGRSVDTHTTIADGDVLIYHATEAGVRMLWGSPRFGHAHQDLYKVSIATDEQASVCELEENEDVEVVAAQTTHLLRDTPARPGDMCLVTAPSADVLTDHPLVGLWQRVAGKAPQTGSAHRGFVTALGSTRAELEHPGDHRRLRRARRHRRQQRPCRPHLRRHPAPVQRKHRSGSADHRRRHHRADQRHHQRRSRGNPHTSRPFRCDDQRPEPGTHAGADRNMHLLHVLQSVQPSVEPDGDETRRLFDGDVRTLRRPTHDRVGGRGGRCGMGPAVGSGTSQIDYRSVTVTRRCVPLNCERRR